MAARCRVAVPVRTPGRNFLHASAKLPLRPENERSRMKRACSSLDAFIAGPADGPPAAARAASTAGNATLRHKRGLSHRRAPRNSPRAIPCERPATGFESVEAIGSRSTEATSGSRNVVANWWRAIEGSCPGSRATIDGSRRKTGTRRNSTLPACVVSRQARGSSARPVRASGCRPRPAYRRPLGRLADERDPLMLKHSPSKGGKLRRGFVRGSRRRADETSWSIHSTDDPILEHASEIGERVTRTARISGLVLTEWRRDRETSGSHDVLVPTSAADRRAAIAASATAGDSRRVDSESTLMRSSRK